MWANWLKWVLTGAALVLAVVAVGFGGVALSAAVGAYTTKSLAEIACLSESQFKVLFKEHLGCTPNAYITNLRMKSALGLILNTDTPIAIVAEKCGYDNVSAFIRRFSSVYHQTPYRLRCNNQNMKHQRIS